MEGRTAVLDAPAPPRRPRLRRLSPRAPRGLWLWLGVAVAVLAGIAVVLAVVLTIRADPAPAGGASAGAPGAEAGALAQAIEQASALAASTSASSLADPTAYSQLLGELTEARLAQSGTGAQASTAREELVAAMDRVTRSQSAEALADARTNLGALLATAAGVNAELEGHVTDEALRAELQARIDAGRAVLASPSSPVDAVNASAQAVTDQTAAVLAARILGFESASGTWCAADGRSCLEIAWPEVRTGDGKPVEATGGDEPLGESGCFETDRIGDGRNAIALLYCPAGQEIPSNRKASGADAGDPAKDRLWLSEDGRLTQLRYRA